MDYKKKLKLFLFSIQVVTFVTVCGITYWQMNDAVPPMSFDSFQEAVDIEKTHYQTNAVLQLEDTWEGKQDHAFHYSFDSAERDQTLTDIRGFGTYVTKEKLKSKVLPAQIEGFKIKLPYNVHWHSDEDMKSLIMIPDTFNQETTIVLDTKLKLEGVQQEFIHQLNPQTENETIQKIYNVYKTKSNYHLKVAKKQQLLFTAISGLISIVVFLIFHLLVFRKYFRKSS